jgi:hypothetical protein
MHAGALLIYSSCAGALVQMLRSEDPGVHYEAVGVLGNLVHSSQDIKQQVLQVRHAVLCSAGMALGSMPKCYVAWQQLRSGRNHAQLVLII